MKSRHPPVEQPDILEEPVTKPIILSGAAKGIAYTLFEGLGAVRSTEIAHLTRALEESDRLAMARLGLRFGVETVYLPDMLKPAQIELRALLWNLFFNDSGIFTRHHLLVVSQSIRWRMSLMNFGLLLVIAARWTRDAR